MSVEESLPAIRKNGRHVRFVPIADIRKCDSSCAGLTLLLDFSRSPSLVKPSFQRAIQTEDHKPALARNCLHPIVLKTGRSLGAKIGIDGTVRIDLEALVLTAHAWELLIGLYKGSGLIVVDDDRPKVLGRDVRRKVQLVSLGAVDGPAL